MCIIGATISILIGHMFLPEADILSGFAAAAAAASVCIDSLQVRQ